MTGAVFLRQRSDPSSVHAAAQTAHGVSTVSVSAAQAGGG